MPTPDPALSYPHLTSPVDIGGLRLPHRVLMGSMHLNLETRGTSALAAFYVERVRGGAGLIVSGGGAVSRVGAGGDTYTLINESEHQERWRAVVDVVHEAGGLIALQLFHAGRYAFESAFGLRPVAPSAVYSSFSRSAPEVLSTAQIAATIGDFAAAAVAGVEVGFDAIEVMASEGYLLNQFASPLTNLRDDEWGGDAERRRAFPVAVVEAVRAAAGQSPLLVRMSGADLMPGSSTQEEVDALAVSFVGAGADAIDVGIGWHESRVPTVQSIVPHGAWIDVAARVKDALVAAGAIVPVIGSNRINALGQAEEVLASGRVDLVSMARPFLADPAIISKSLAGASDVVNTCIGCNEACIDRSFGPVPVSCLVNPRAGRELEFPEEALGGAAVDVVGAGAASTSVSAYRGAATAAGAGASGGIRVAVVGAGPAGMEAARAAATRGADVVLFEAGRRIGGQFLLAGMVPGKADFLETVRYFENELDRLGASVQTEASIESADALAGFDHVIVATGVRPRTVTLPGANLHHVLTYPQAFQHVTRGGVEVGERVAIIGAGGIGVDLAHLLVETGRTVTVMRRSGPIGAGMGITTRWAVVQAIRAAGVRTLTDVVYHSIEDDGVLIEHDNASELIAADTVVLAAGQEPQAALASILDAAGIRNTVIGGALATNGTNAVVAFEQGLRAGTALASATYTAKGMKGAADV